MTELLTMIKPWAFKHRTDILYALNRAGKMIHTAEIFIPDSLLHCLYGRFKGQPFYDLLISDMMNREGVISIYDGNIEKFMELKEGIREKLDSLLPAIPYANANNVGYKRNSLHTSDSVEAAEREVGFTKELLKNITRLVRTNSTWQM